MALREIEIISNNGKIRGRRLEAGEIIEENDLYLSTCGRWEKIPCPGMSVGEKSVDEFVRPYPEGKKFQNE